MKKYISLIISFMILISASVSSFASVDGSDIVSIFEYYYSLGNNGIQTINNIEKPSLDIYGKGLVLIEASTGTVLYEENKDEKLPPASVTKVMTMLLIMEAIDKGKISFDDKVVASEHAVSMGGTQIYLELGETMTVHELLKAVAVPSANDAAVALAEHIAGSETEFVRMMNKKALDLGMNNSNFTNCTGLFDDENHYTTAYDLALATKELLSHPKILEYTTIWMDSLRNGEFGLANTNKLLRTYSGMNGMKTGYTKLAGHCLSGTALRNNMQLIAVVLGSPTSQDRFNAVSKMLDYGFSTFSVISESAEIPDSIQVTKGKTDQVKICLDDTLEMVVLKGQDKQIQVLTEISDSIEAPVVSGQTVGSVTYKMKDEVIKVIPIKTVETIERADFTDYFIDILCQFLI
ncbi:MAG: D-alanyl-D-alanine carboxypeptidase [Ruminococcaceae bacterium]|nr:D-alanyl-D-alanine carboxypeptidase [Oscillospiraceae bacterium]